MQFRRSTIALSAALIALAGTAGIVVAQMESGDRGILPIDSSGTLEIGGIDVDVGAKDADSARYAGWRIAQREGFKKLWAQVNKRPISEAPSLSDSTLDGLVSSIVVEKEQIGPNRYIATLGVLFDRSLAGQLLGVGGEIRRSPPMLLIPVTITGGTAQTVELKNPWQRAWAQLRTSQSPINYVRVSGLGGDPLMANAAVSRRTSRTWWRNVLDLYGAANVLTAEVQLDRTYPGGPTKAHFTGRFGPDATALGSFDLVARDSNDIARMMSEGVQRMDRLFAQAYAQGVVRSDPNLITLPPPPPVEELDELAAPDTSATSTTPTTGDPIAPAPMSGFQLLAATPDAAALSAILSRVSGISGVEGVGIVNSNIGGNSRIVVRFKGNSDELRSALSGAGLGIDFGSGVMRISLGGGR
nr:heavy-metal-associated domain-containing protein [uncultured Sphingomonas sp.]